MKKKHLLFATGLTIITSILLYFLLTAIYRLPTSASAEAGPIDQLFHIHFGFIAFFFSLIMVFVVYAALVFRRRPDDETDGPHIHGHTGLEITWTVIPVIIVLGLGVYGTNVLVDITAPQPNEMVVKVHARQWSWSFEYPDYENISSAELILPANQPIRLEMDSEDVIHSFWVPEFRVKQDVVPGRTTILRFTPTQAGDYKVRCAEICGKQHANMLAPVKVLSDQEFTAWVDERLAQPLFAELTPEERGEIWYSAEGFGCAACHSVDGTQIVGPTWLGLFGREEQMDDGSTIVVDETYLRESILNPNAKIVSGFNANIMPPNYEQRFAEKQAEILAAEGVEIDIVEDLIAYIKTLNE
ncbi:MAG: cytochrome c oxidase subunit II [Chloroflexi bacterium]|nr:MAG: cytochrome c oxidase subunit II [Chloroflexota bacterium]